MKGWTNLPLDKGIKLIPSLSIQFTHSLNARQLVKNERLKNWREEVRQRRWLLCFATLLVTFLYDASSLRFKLFCDYSIGEGSCNRKKWERKKNESKKKWRE